MKRRLPGDEYQQALNAILDRVQQSLQRSARGALPVRMYIAGGAALYLHTGARVSEDIDATFSAKILLGDDIEVAYRDADGRARLVYLDRSYNDSLGLLHEDAYRDSQPIDVPGIDPQLLEVRVLSPLDLAVSKLARLADQDREDIQLLAHRRLIDAARLRKRAEEALGGYVGDAASVRTSIDLACRLVDAARPATAARKKPKGR